MILSVSLHQLKRLFKSQSLFVKNINVVVAGGENLYDIIYNLLMLFVVHTVLFYLCSERRGLDSNQRKTILHIAPLDRFGIAPCDTLSTSGRIRTRRLRVNTDDFGPTRPPGQLFTDCHY